MENALKTKNLYDSFSKKIIFQNSEYEVHQVTPKDSGSKNYSFRRGTNLVLPAPARDRGQFSVTQIMLFMSIKSFFHFS
jgi:hypothetical protein